MTTSAVARAVSVRLSACALSRAWRRSWLGAALAALLLSASGCMNHYAIYPERDPPGIVTWSEYATVGPLLMHLEWASPTGAEPFPAVIVQATLGMAGAILAEASLSFLGLGVQPPTPSWGTMLDAGRSHLFDAPHLTVFPGLAIAMLVLGFNLVGDGLRDRLDPRGN